MTEHVLRELTMRYSIVRKAGAILLYYNHSCSERCSEKCQREDGCSTHTCSQKGRRKVYLEAEAVKLKVSRISLQRSGCSAGGSNTRRSQRTEC